MSYKGVIFDMDGVLRIGNHPVKGASEIIEKLNNNNIKGMISTNECRYTDVELKDELTEMGVNIPDDWPIYTSGMAVRDYLETKIKKHPERNFSIGIIGECGLFETINELTRHKNVEITDIPPKYETKLILIIGTVNKIKITNLEKGLKWLKAGAKVIKTCSDVSDPASKGDFNLGMPNHILHLLNYNIKSTKCYSLGKPHPIHAIRIRKNFPGVPFDELLFVGDTIYTDIQLAEESGMSSCVVLTGNTNKETLKNYIIEPDMVINSIIDLSKVFGLNSSP